MTPEHIDRLRAAAEAMGWEMYGGDQDGLTSFHYKDGSVALTVSPGLYGAGPFLCCINLSHPDRDVAIQFVQDNICGVPGLDPLKEE